jgi:hypothetical protein
MNTPSFERFCKTFTNGVGRKEKRFIDTYGDVSFEQAYPLYLEKIGYYDSLRKKINNFEQFLISQGVEGVQSKVSESTYYNWGGKKYRFSNHIYPTGSMTNDFTVDLCADPHLINEINF